MKTYVQKCGRARRPDPRQVTVAAPAAPQAVRPKTSFSARLTSPPYAIPATLIGIGLLLITAARVGTLAAGILS